MARDFTRASVRTVVDLRLDVRRMASDIDGDSIPADSDKRWSDDAIDRHLFYQMSEMYSHLSQMDPGTYIQIDTLTYTADADSTTMADTSAASPILSVHRVDGSAKTRLKRVDWHEIEQLRLTDDEDEILRSTVFSSGTVFSIKDNGIALRPVPSTAVTLEIAYVGNPFTVEGLDDSDQHAYPVVFEELICLGAALKLLSYDDEAPIQMSLRHDRLMDQFIKNSDRYIGPRRPLSVRRYR